MAVGGAGMLSRGGGSGYVVPILFSVIILLLREALFTSESVKLGHVRSFVRADNN